MVIIIIKKKSITKFIYNFYKIIKFPIIKNIIY